MPDLTADEIELTVDEELHKGVPKQDKTQARAFRDEIDRAGKYHYPILYWVDGDRNVILDGRHRYWDWCDRPDGTPIPPPRVEELCLPDRQAARAEVVRLALGQWNLPSKTKKQFIGELYNERKRDRASNLKSGKNAEFRPKDQTDPSGDTTAEQIADEQDVSPSSVKRYGALVEAKNAIAQTLPALHSDIESSSVKLSDNAIKQVAQLDKTGMAKVRNNLKKGESWDAGLNSKAAGNGRPAASGQPAWNFKKHSSAVGSLMRFLDDVKNAHGAVKEYKACLGAARELSNGLDALQKRIT